MAAGLQTRATAASGHIGIVTLGSAWTCRRAVSVGACRGGSAGGSLSPGALKDALERRMSAFQGNLQQVLLSAYSSDHPAGNLQAMVARQSQGLLRTC